MKTVKKVVKSPAKKSPVKKSSSRYENDYQASSVGGKRMYGSKQVSKKK
jgi:hypothetical protein